MALEAPLIEDSLVMAGFLSKLNPAGLSPAFFKHADKPIDGTDASTDLAKSNDYTHGNYRGRDSDEPRIIYKIEPRARRISIKLDAAGRMAIVTAPHDRDMVAARKFAKEKSDWIKVHLQELPPAQPFIHGGKIYFKGALTHILSEDGRGRPKFQPGYKDEDLDQTIPPQLIVPAPLGALEGRMRRFLIRQAREALEPATYKYAQMLGKEVHKITVRDTKSRWGSCAQNGHISYSWRLICAPEWVLDYVAAHEAAHLVEANHSQDFWDVVDQLVDTATAGRKWLNRHGSKLHAVGAPY